jgi:hypothetical protein
MLELPIRCSVLPVVTDETLSLFRLNKQRTGLTFNAEGFIEVGLHALKIKMELVFLLREIAVRE